MQATLSRLGYLALGKRAKGIVRRYVLAVTGYSRAQGTRLIRQYRRTGRVQRQGARQIAHRVHQITLSKNER